jgi:hypothetical protein
LKATAIRMSPVAGGRMEREHLTGSSRIYEPLLPHHFTEALAA